jgi:hypothetical protein
MYMGGILIWLLLWSMVDGYTLMQERVHRLWIPFFMALLILLANLVLWSLFPGVASLEVEESLFTFVDHRTSNVAATTASILVIATIIFGTARASIPESFLRYVAYSFICFIGFVAPIIWIPPQHPEWLVLLRHYQTIAFTYGVFLSVSGVLVLLHSLRHRDPDSAGAVGTPTEKSP